MAPPEPSLGNRNRRGYLVDLEESLFERADWDDEPAPWLELLDQSLRDGWARRNRREGRLSSFPVSKYVEIIGMVGEEKGFPRRKKQESKQRVSFLQGLTRCSRADVYGIIRRVLGHAEAAVALDEDEVAAVEEVALAVVSYVFPRCGDELGHVLDADSLRPHIAQIPPRHRED
jgi:hypothetical protein